MFTVADGAEFRELAAYGQEGDAGIAEAERGKLFELLAEHQIELRSTHYGVDRHRRHQVLIAQNRARMSGEGLGEGVHVLRANGKPCSRSVSTPALQVLGAGGKRTVQVEGGDRAP